MSQFCGEAPNNHPESSIEVIPLIERPDLAYGIYDVIDRNRPSLSRYGIRTSGYYPTLEFFLTDVAASLEANRVPTTDMLVDFNAVVLGSDVVGEVDIVVDEELEHSRILGWYVDIEGGFAQRGIMSRALKLVRERYAADPDIDILRAFINARNLPSRKLAEKSGFEQLDKREGVIEYRLHVD